jgi:uncharacterized protein YecT (DUF1311 family)
MAAGDMGVSGMWQVLLFSLLFPPAGSVASQGTAPCAGKLGSELSGCKKEELSTAKALAEKYLGASRKELAGRPADLKALDLSQKLWESFVAADCAAAYEHFSGGSARSSQAIECQLAHEGDRTYWLWSRYLAGTSDDPGEPRRECQP